MTDLATGLDAPAGLALDSRGGLFFAEANAGKIKTVPQAGGTVTTISDNLTRPYDVLVDQVNGFEALYFVEYDPAAGRVGKTCLTGCVSNGSDPNQPGSVESLAVDQPGSIALTLDASNVYYLNRENQEVMRVSKDAGTPSAPIPLAQSPGVTRPQDIVRVDSTLYFTDADPLVPSNGALRCVSTTGGVVTNIATGLNQPGPLETAGTNLYFAEVAAGTSNGTIQKIANVSCTANLPLIPLADGLSEPRGIAIDTNGDVYYTEWAAGRIGWVQNGMGQATLVSGLNHPFRLILDSQFIYFTETDTVF